MAGRDLERPDLYVVARLLERLWREDAPMLKTRLQVAANVNYDVVSRYLNWMLAKGLVVLAGNPDRDERVVLLPKGAEAYRRAVPLGHTNMTGQLPHWQRTVRRV